MARSQFSIESALENTTTSAGKPAPPSQTDLI
jgi:hypothetical protein